VSQARTARSALGQLGCSVAGRVSVPPLSGVVRDGLRNSSGVVACGWLVEPGVPAERERAVDQGLVAADRGRGADLEVGPAQFVLDLFVALLDPVPDPVEPHDLGQISRLVQPIGGVVGAVGAGQVGGQVSGAFVGQDLRVGGGDDQAGVSVGSPPAELGVGGPPGLGVPVTEPAHDRLPAAGIVGAAPGHDPGGVFRGVTTLCAIADGVVSCADPGYRLPGEAG